MEDDIIKITSKDLEEEPLRITAQDLESSNKAAQSDGGVIRVTADDVESLVRQAGPQQIKRLSFSTPWFLATLSALAIVLLCVIAALIWFSQPKAPSVVLQRARSETPSPGSTPVSSETPSTTTTWQTFEGTGYTLIYPSDWYIYRANVDERTGVRYDLILSNAPGNRSPQNATPDESARVMVSYLPRAQQPLDEWVIQRWAWLDAPLTPATIDGTSAFTATALSTEPPLLQEFLWIEYRGRYYTIQAYARADAPDALDKIKKIMDSFKLKE